MDTCDIHSSQPLDDDGECAWCMEVFSLRGTINELRKHLKEKSVIVNDGSPRFEGPIGYLAVYGGEVLIENADHRESHDA